MTASQLMCLAGEYTVARMLERDDFQTRYRSGRPIGVHEFLYPLVQGYDSVVLESDVELGGTDQKFNLLVGRDLQRNRDKEPQVVMTMPLLEGLDGVQKMSKSLGNAVGISEPPAEMFGKIMSISDTLMARYYELLSSAGLDVVAAVREGAIHPMEAKKRLALELTARYHGEKAAVIAREEFERQVQRRQLPEQIAEVEWRLSKGTVGVCELLKGVGMVASLSEARRLVAQGGVRVDGERVSDSQAQLVARGSVLLQVGKRKLLKVRFSV
jgi:tyrosyl-tRNA synthetase